MKLLIMQFSSTFYHFIPLRSKYSHLHPVLKYQNYVLLHIINMTSCEILGFHGSGYEEYCPLGCDTA
jgi:hypothetical protein